MPNIALLVRAAVVSWVVPACAAAAVTLTRPATVTTRRFVRFAYRLAMVITLVHGLILQGWIRSTQFCFLVKRVADSPWITTLYFWLPFLPQDR